METMQHMFVQSDVSRSLVDERLGELSRSIERMTHQMQHGDAENSALERVAAGQERLITHLETFGGGEGGIDAESRMRLRSIDVQMLRILEEISAGRQESMAELRTDISALAQAFSQPRGQARRLAKSKPEGVKQQDEPE
jgi:flagellar biosynthesis regulator FlaF